MSTYVMSDIHGCYDSFLQMLSKIGFSDADQLILAGDYIDRGPDSYQMLKWMEHCPGNVHLLRGNHEEEFAGAIDLMLEFDQRERLNSDFASNRDAAALYRTVKYFFKNESLPAKYFDFYETIYQLLRDYSVTLRDLSRWAAQIREMPYYRKLQIGEKPCVVVHGGYAENPEEIGDAFESLEEFYLYAREESCELGGVRHGMVIAGHTPTIARWEFAYNRGNVFRYYDADKDCVFYDIDCGCAYRAQDPDGKLACIRLEDERIFYV